MEKSIEKRQRISSITATLMLATAGMFDFVQFIPFVGWLISGFLSIFVWLTFFVWFKIKGIGFLDKGARLAVVFFLGAFIEIIPVLNILPAWILSITIMLLIIKAEDTIFNKTGKNIEIRKILKK